MKRIILVTLALALALSLCACRERGTDAAQTAVQPTEEPKKLTPAEAVTAAMETMAGVDNAHVQMTITIGVNASLREKQVVVPQTETETGADGTIEESHMKLEAQIDADFMRAPFILKGTVTLDLSEESETQLEKLPFCLWQEDGELCVAMGYDVGGKTTWYGYRMGAEDMTSMVPTQENLAQYQTLLRDWAEHFSEAGETTVNGEPATAYEAQIDGEMMRKMFESYTDPNGEPLLTFSDELIKELPPIRFVLAVDANGMPVYQEVDAAAFASVLIERVLYASIGETNDDFTLETLQLKTTLSQVNAVDSIEIPEDVVFNDYSTAMPSVSGFLGA